MWSIVPWSIHSLSPPFQETWGAMSSTSSLPTSRSGSPLPQGEDLPRSRALTFLSGIRNFFLEVTVDKEMYVQSSLYGCAELYCCTEVGNYYRTLLCNVS